MTKEQRLYNQVRSIIAQFSNETKTIDAATSLILIQTTKYNFDVVEESMNKFKEIKTHSVWKDKQ